MVSTTAISAKQDQQYTAADVNDDGYLTESEFNEAFPNEKFSDYDENGDGNVTKEEYTEKILTDNKKIAETMWSMAMKIFGLDKIKPADLGLDAFKQ